jgi:Ribosomally synthesized peptide prototyped by Frankia Franean1_4349.
MAQVEIERVMGRAGTDSAFRQALLTNAREACRGYDLTEDELEALEQLDPASVEAFAGTLENAPDDPADEVLAE